MNQEYEPEMPLLYCLQIERRRHYEWDLFRKRMEAADEAVKESLTEKEATIILHN